MDSSTSHQHSSTSESFLELLGSDALVSQAPVYEKTVPYAMGGGMEDGNGYVNGCNEWSMQTFPTQSAPTRTQVPESHAISTAPTPPGLYAHRSIAHPSFPTPPADVQPFQQVTNPRPRNLCGQGTPAARGGENIPPSKVTSASSPAPATQSHMHKAKRKVADTNRTRDDVKGFHSADTTSSSQLRRGGRKTGASNFTPADIQELLRLIGKTMPIGEMGWQQVVDGYAAYALKNGRPKRDVRSLRLKYYKLVNAKKKTGDPECPWDVREAKRLDRAIESRILMASMNDNTEDKPIPPEWEADKNTAPESEESDAIPEDKSAHATSLDTYDSGADNSSDDASPDEDQDTHPAKRTKVQVTEPASRNVRVVQRRHRDRAADLLSNLQQHLDPEARAAREASREEARTVRFGQLMQLLNERSDRAADQAEIRELRRQVDDLRQQLADARLENMTLRNQIQMMQFFMGAGVYQADGYAQDVSQFSV